MNLLVEDPGLIEVSRFVRAKLRGFDLSRLDRFRIMPNGGTSRYHGICMFPFNGRGYRIRVSVRMKQSFPYRERKAVSTWRKGAATGGAIWGYRFEDVVFEDVRELAVFVAGHETFHFLRQSRQIPGRQSETQANAYGIEWLERWRAARQREARRKRVERLAARRRAARRRAARERSARR